MKIKDILELTYTEPLAEIAKNHLPVGEKKARAILKEINCRPNGTGKKGWTYAGENPEILEKDFSEFVQKATKNKVKTSNSKSTKASNQNRPNKITGQTENAIEYRSIEGVTENSVHDIINKNKEKGGNTMKNEILSLIKGEKEENERIYKGIYFDKDLAHFLDNVQHGNKSEIVNRIMRQYLTENDLL